MNEFLVRLSDDTCGKYYSDEESIDNLIGEDINVELDDENGNKIEKTGILEEILN